MERKIGETFEYKGKTYKVVESKLNLCSDCSFGEVCDGRTIIVTGNCISTNRFDKKNVIFKEVKNMETKINIAEILKDKPKGVRLYSPIFGECAFCYVREDTDDICVKKHNGEKAYFNSKGLYCTLGEVMLYPSKEMRDWHKFAWKKGDILVNGDKDVHIIFEAFENDTYTRFKGKHYLWKGGNKEDYSEEETYMLTSVFEKANDDAVKCYINTIEERLCGKLNMETLDIEKSQPEFRDGDIVTATSDFGSIFIGILKKSIKDFPNKELRFYCALENSEQLAFGGLEVMLKATKTSFATEEEKRQLFSAIAKKGKAWDADKKMIVDLKPKIELKPFDKVLARNSNTQKWEADLFSFKSDTGLYHCVGFIYNQCIPYEGNESLLGTTKDVEG